IRAHRDARRGARAACGAGGEATAIRTASRCAGRRAVHRRPGRRSDGVTGAGGDRVREQAERILADVPAWLWDGERLPVPVEDIVDSCFGLHVRDVEDMSVAPGAPAVDGGQQLSGLLLPARGEIWVNADEARRWPPRRRFTIG